ncbi:MAG: toll/interleukin-1 receptor domain-containing protein [Alphaproteobacteria bacterium]|nr:toll/interleukin-1 receptor domain-containing protein [Alphaproteobacteria bacterium]
MLYVTDAHKFIRTFISHSVEDNVEATYYKNLLTKKGFTVFQYEHDLEFGRPISGIIERQIRDCHFFLFIVSDYSQESKWVQKELGLAIRIQRKNKGYRPIIIPIYAKAAVWRKNHNRPKQFPTCDFYKGTKRKGFDLGVRGIDKYENPDVDTDNELISLMSPSLLVSRYKHDKESTIDHEVTFEETGVFKLYRDMFPIESERDSPNDIIRWVLRSDLGKPKSMLLPDGTALEYTLDSRYFIMQLAGRAIGLAFFTYDYKNNLMYGNYIAVHGDWREGHLAKPFVDKIMDILGELFPKFEGVVFEVEKIDREKVEYIISYLKDSPELISYLKGSLKLSYLKESPDKLFHSPDDLREIKKVKRVLWYQRLGCQFFIDINDNKPLTSRSPCLSPGNTDWPTQEEEWWVMWYNRPGQQPDWMRVGDLWERSIRCMYIEILAKSLVESVPAKSQKYWAYANGVVEEVLHQSDKANISFGPSLHSHDPLTRKWEELGIKIKI